jgi:hypothetical protein
MRRAALAFLLLTRAAMAAPSLLHNGSFERGDFAGWTLTGNTQYSQVFNQPYDGLSAHGGQDYALLGPQGTAGVLSQSFADAAGQALTISFWLASDGGATDFFGASFDGKPLMQVSDTGAFGWRHYTETVTATGWDTLSFSFLDDQDYFALDSVRVLQAASAPDALRSGGPIPEPTTLLLLPAALLALTLRRSRQGGRSF